MALGAGGRLYPDFDALRPGEHYRPDGPRDVIRPKDLDGVGTAFTGAGAVIVHSTVRGDARRVGSSGRAIGGGMAEVNAGRRSLRGRAVERVARAVAGDRLDALQHRLDELEAEVQECRQLNLRLAEVTDLVEELLLPMVAQDQERLAAAVEKYTRSV